MANYVPVPTTPQVHGEPISAANYNGEGGVRKEWWWQAGPVDSCCFCCSLRAGVGVLAVLDILFNGIWQLVGLGAVESMQESIEQFYEENCTGKGETVDPPCEDLAKSVHDIQARVEVMEEVAPLMTAAGFLAILAGFVGLWAVLRRNTCAAKMYMIWWPIKYVWNLVFLFVNHSTMKAYGLKDDSSNVFTLALQVFFFLYYLKVSWSFYMRLKRSAHSTSSADATGNVQQHITTVV